ncbi:MAG: hypothetical protein ACYC1X_01070 [Coriobacteriia bacterium]
MRTGILCARNESLHDTHRGRASVAKTSGVTLRSITPATSLTLLAEPSGRAEVIYPVFDPSAGLSRPEGLAASASGARTFAREEVPVRRDRSY